MKIKPLLSGIGLSLAAASASAEVIDVEITNLTNGIYFTPILIAAHDSDSALFTIGEPASDALATMAEGGAIADLSSAVTDAGGVVSENPAGGPLAPSDYAIATGFDTGDASYLSITAMLIPTNDGFVGLDSWPIPSEPGSYTVYLNGYDAGSEINDEIVNGGGALGAPGIPVDFGNNNGTGGTGVTDQTETNETVHIHRGVLGDSDPTGGPSDLNSSVHRWLNPVAKVVVTVN